jgi:hypothetical protein
MIKKNAHMAWVLAVLGVFVLGSCDDYFSTSWGTVRSYEASKIALSEGNLKDWKNKAVGNPKLAAALVDKILGELEGKSGAEKAEFQKVGIDLAIEQSGMGVKILELAGSDLSKIVEGTDDEIEKGVKDLLSKVQSGVLESSKAAAGNIAKIVGTSITENSNPPVFNGDDYTTGVTASEVGLAVMILAMAEIPSISSDMELDDLTDKIPALTINPNNELPVSVTGNTDNVNDNQIALAAYLNLIASNPTEDFRNNPITGGIKSAFKLSKEEKL